MSEDDSSSSSSSLESSSFQIFLSTKKYHRFTLTAVTNFNFIKCEPQVCWPEADIDLTNPFFDVWIYIYKYICMQCTTPPGWPRPLGPCGANRYPVTGLKWYDQHYQHRLTTQWHTHRWAEQKYSMSGLHIKKIMTSLDMSLDRFKKCAIDKHISQIKSIAAATLTYNTYSFFFDGFLFGLSPSESLLPWLGRTQRFRTQQKHLLTITTRSTWTKLKDPLGGTMSRVVRQTAQTDLSSGRLSYPFTSAPIFKRAGSCLLRFDLLTPYTSGCSSHICTQRPTPH